MIEVVFTESAGGSLKLAQSFGKGKYHGGAIGVLIHHEDGSKPTQEEIDEAQRRAEAQQRKAWESAIPLGGKSRDVYCFSLGLGFGDIRNPLCLQDRLNAHKVLFSFWNAEIEAELSKQLQQMRSDLDILRNRIASGKDVRVWYSDSPDELCGFYWLMEELRHLPDGHGTIYALKQPEFEETGDSVIQYSGWGEVEPGHFGAFTHLAKPVSDQMRHIYGNIWKTLQSENTEIRACINGRLRSAPEDLYDRFIQMELEKMPSEFKEAVLVGSVLGKYTPGISDGYLHRRINCMVQKGDLIPTTRAGEGEPEYWRILKKV